MQEYWSGQPFLSPEDLSDPGIEPRSPALQVDSLPSEPVGKPKVCGLTLILFQLGNSSIFFIITHDYCEIVQQILASKLSL